ncbi:MAG: T9SS type A sorting domain-containing protein, partial [Candidatus Latescibacteria bacterium]|nr:T9SS type A sorting domain-containing protein [Candidatus Latescibacterota bacterium]
VSGTDATVILIIFTKDKERSIKQVTNGYLGWHYVNKIDTCVYISQPYQFDQGKYSIFWDGSPLTDDYMNYGEYNYYLFGYDNISPKILVAEHMPIQWDDMSNIVTHDQYGNPLSQPVIYSGVNEWKTQQEPWDRIRSKWFIGNDPSDESLIETTQYSGWYEHCQLIPYPYEDQNFFISTLDNNGTSHIRRYTWVPNGDAGHDLEWDDDGDFQWYVNTKLGDWCEHLPLQYAGKDCLVATNASISGFSTESELVIISALEGEEQFRIDLSQWWIDLDEAEMGGQVSGGPTDIAADPEHRALFLSSHTSCMNQMINPLKGEDEEDWNLWVNGNGDYFADKNFGNDSEKSWICNDYDEPPYIYSGAVDKNLFSLFTADGIGEVSFGVFAPDGTGVGYFSFANETAGYKYRLHVVDTGSAYDGIYCDNASIITSLGVPDEGWWYVAQDCFKGVIELWNCEWWYEFHWPDASEDLIAGTVHYMGWLLHPCFYKNARKESNNYMYAYTTDGGENWTIIEENIDFDSNMIYSCEWTVPDVETTKCYIVFTDDSTFDDYLVISPRYTIIRKTSNVEKTPTEFAVFQNSPNPFNPSTTITFTIPKSGTVTADIYNTAGQKVATPVSDFMETGKHSVVWDAGEFPAGVYFCRVTSGRHTGTVKMTVVK